MRIVVLFNLKQGVEPGDYEAWARTTDIPGVRGLASVNDFQVYRTAGTLGGGVAPYAYIETIDITGMEAFMSDVTSDAVQKVAAQFQNFADNPQFILTEAL